MRLNDRYDWVVLGDHPGGLLSGCLAAKLGFSVLVLPLQESRSLFHSRQGQIIDPEPNFILGLGKKDDQPGLLRETLQKLGLSNADTERVVFSPRTLQVAAGQSCFFFPSDVQAISKGLEFACGYPPRTLDSLELALSSSSHLIRKFWNTLPERLTVVTDAKNTVRQRAFPITETHLKKALSGYKMNSWLTSRPDYLRLPESERFELFLRGILYGLTGVDSERDQHPSGMEVVQRLVLGSDGASYRGGLSAFRRSLQSLAKKLGVHVPEKTECRRIFIQDGKLLGLQASHRASMVAVRGAMIGGSPHLIEKFLDVSGSTHFRKKMGWAKPQFWLFTLALTVRKEAIPPGFGRRVVSIQEDSPPVEIETAEFSDFGREDSQYCLLFARVPIPFTAESIDIEKMKTLGGRLLREVHRILPFLEFHLKRVFPSSDGEYRELYGFKNLDEIPENLRRYRAGSWKVGAFTGIEGVFTSSTCVAPHLGSLSWTVTAHEAVAWLAHRSGLRGPLV